MKKKICTKRVMLVIAVFILSIFLTSNAMITQDVDVKAILTAPNESQCVPGEFILKLKDGETLAALGSLSEEFEITSIEKVFPDLTDPAEKLKNLQNKLRNLTIQHERWYWQTDKNSKEHQDYIARIDKEKQDLKEQIKLQEKIVARFKRAKESGLPNLDDIYLMRTSTPYTDITQITKVFSAHPAVSYAEPNYIMKINVFPQTLPNDTYVDPGQAGIWKKGTWGQSYEDLWGVKKAIEKNGLRAWGVSQGEGVIVAVIDTGVDYNHEDIIGNMWHNPGEVQGNGIDDDGNGKIDDYYGYDYVNKDGDPLDDHGHGTHCAGTIAAVGNNAKGVIGVAPCAKIMAIKGLSGSGSGDTIGLVQCVYYAVDNGADVLSNSWGGSGTSQLFNDAFAYAASNGVVPVAAAGNSNMDAKDFTPANAPSVITVAALDAFDRKASFSNWGSTVAIAAPGVDTLSLRANNTSMGTRVDDKYTRASGTSMACPHAAGVCALLLKKNPGLNLEQVKTILRATALPLPNVPENAKLISFSGRISAKDALDVGIVDLCVAKITAPNSGEYLRNQEEISIKGLAYGGRFGYYVLEYALESAPNEWINIPTLRDNHIPLTTETAIGRVDIRNLTNQRLIFRLRVYNNEVPAREFVSMVQAIVDNAGFTYPADKRILPMAGEIEIKGYATGHNFSNYTLKFSKRGQETWSSNGIRLNNGAQPKSRTSDILGYFDLSVITETDNYELMLEVNYLDGRQVRLKREFRCDKSLKLGWPVSIPGLGDEGWWSVDKVNVNIIKENAYSKKLVASSFQNIYIVEPNGQIRKIPRNFRYALGPESFLSVADMDGDGAEEILTPQYLDVAPEDFAVGRRSPFYFKSDVYKIDGSRLLQWPEMVHLEVGGGIYIVGLTYPAVADIDGDTRMEVAYTAYAKNINGVNTQAWSLVQHNGVSANSVNWPVRENSPIGPDGVFESLGDSGPALADLNDDGKKEMIFWSNISGLLAFSQNGTLMPGWVLTNDPINIGVWDKVRAPVVADLNNDNKYEIMLCGPNGYLYLFDNFGRLLEKEKNDRDSINSIAVANLDFDMGNILEIVVRGVKIGTHESKLYIYRYQDGTLSLVKEGIIPVSFLAPTIAIGDINADSKLEIVTGIFEGVAAYSPEDISLGPIWKKQAIYGAGYGMSVGTVMLTDIDSDNKMDVVAYNSFGEIFAWGTESPATAANMPWPQFQHDPQHSGCYGALANPGRGRGTPPVNHSPILAPVGAQIVKEGDLLSITLSATDEDADDLVYSVNPLLSGVRFNAVSGDFEWRPEVGQRGNYTLTFAVDDGQGGTDSEEVLISVNKLNRPPTLDPIPVRVIAEGQTLSLVLSGSDPDGDDLTYQVVGVPPEHSRIKENRFIWDVDYDQAGDYNIDFRAYDGTEYSLRQRAHIVVNNTNRSPVLAPIGPRSVAEGELLSIVLSATDEDRDTLTYSVNPLLSGAKLNSSTGVFKWKPYVGQKGNYSLTFTVSDGKGGTDSEEVFITVKRVNRPPKFTTPPPDNITLQEGESRNFMVVATDPDGDPVNLSASGLRNWMSFENGRFVMSPGAQDGGQGAPNGGRYIITFTANDGCGGTVSKVTNISVLDVPGKTTITVKKGTKSLKGIVVYARNERGIIYCGMTDAQGRIVTNKVPDGGYEFYVIYQARKYSRTATAPGTVEIVIPD